MTLMEVNKQASQQASQLRTAECQEQANWKSKARKLLLLLMRSSAVGSHLYTRSLDVNLDTRLYNCEQCAGRLRGICRDEAGRGTKLKDVASSSWSAACSRKQVYVVAAKGVNID